MIFDISQFNIFDVLILLGLTWIILLLFTPQFRLWNIRRRRLFLIRDMERQWGTRVLAMVHRKESISLFGVPVYQYIDIEDAEEILRGIRDAGDDPVDLILHTPGGQLLASIQIARALKGHRSRTRVMVPHYSMSGGSIIALAADEIIMDRDATLGPIDPQVGDFLRGMYPAPSWVNVAEKKGLNATDTTLIFSDLSQKALELMRNIARELLADKISDADKLNTLIDKLVGGEMIHSQPISSDEAQALGLPVSIRLPPEVHDFMKLYRSGRTNVEYIR